MNPSFFAFQKAYLRASINFMMGVSHKPKAKRDPTEGKLFSTPEGAFPRSDIIMMAEEEQKERNMREHLETLTAEVKERSDAEKLKKLSDTGRIHTRTRVSSPRKPREDGNFL